MEFEDYFQRFTEKALASGYSAENIKICLDYAKPLLDKKLPVIYTTSHFAGLVGYKQSYLARAIVFTHYFYRHFSINKQNGDKRPISEPLPSLKEIQTWILLHILYNIQPSKFAKAYIPGTTLKQNLVFHREQSMILKLDIKDFFGSIRRPKIEKVFRRAGYSFYLSNLMSKLCCLDECLPQGAPTSPYLSNLVMLDFDETVSSFCLSKKIRYTRYADDLTFSGEFNPGIISSLVSSELKKISLVLNSDKTHLMKKGQRQSVTGITVNKKIQVSREKRMEIRQAIHYIKTYGLDDHLKRIESKKSNYLSHLLGQVLHVLFINPDDKEFIAYKEFLNTAMK